MDKKEIVEMVSKLLSFAKTDAPTAAPAPEATADSSAPLEVTTKDGIVLSTTAPKFDMGVEIMVDGAPAPDAVYELEDGSKITTVGGLITDITAVAETPAAEVTETSMETPMAMSAENDKFLALEEKFNKVLEATIVLSEAFNKLPVSDKIVINASSNASDEEFGRKAMTKKEKNLKEMASVLEEIRSEQNKNNK